MKRCSPASDEGEAPALERLPAKQALEAIALVESDPDVKRLTGGRPYTTESPFLWTAGGDSSAFGAVVPMVFEGPFSLSADDWPVVVSAGAGRPDADETPRLLCTTSIEAENVIRIETTVNLQSEEVEELRVDDFRVEGTTVEYGDLGELPEEYTPVPGY